MRKFWITTLVLPIMLFTTPSFAFSWTEPCFGLVGSLSCEAPTSGDRNDGKGQAADRSFDTKGDNEGEGDKGKGKGKGSHSHGKKGDHSAGKGKGHGKGKGSHGRS
jgi:hypothetical protein